MKQSTTILICCFLLLLTVSGNSDLQAQLQFPKSTKPKGAPIKTSVSVTLLMENTSSALFAQEWGRIFRDLNISILTRRASGDDIPEIKQNVRGTFREVRLIGTLDRRGEVQFPGHKFARKDVRKLKEWLNDLKTYGAQGSPESKPLWGLSPEQFRTVFAELSEPTPVNVQGMSLKEAISKLDFPNTLPVRMNLDAEKRVSEKHKNLKVIPDFEKLAKGTVLAIMLKQYGLVFYPSRTPSGSLELVVAPIGSTSSPWPIGWELKESRQKTAPRYFQLIPVKLTDVPLRDVLIAASKASGIPMIVDEYAVRKKGIDLDQVKVNISKKRTTWSILIRNALGQDGLVRKLVIDERGQPFIWITVFVPKVSSAIRK